MKNIRIYDDGSVDVVTPLPITDAHFAIVRMLPNPGQTFENEVMAAPVNDQDVPIKFGKGSPILCRSFFSFMSKIQTPQAFRWAVEPNILWINERYFEDSFWPNFDPQGNAPDAREPISECIYYPCNFIAWDFRQGDWFHLISYRNTEPPTDPFADNWITKPWLWGKAQARNIRDSHLSNPGLGLDVYLPLIKKTLHTWMHISQLEMLPSLPYTLSDGQVVVSYQLRGTDVIGITKTGTFLYLRAVTKFGGMSEPYSWHLQTPPCIPPEGF